MNTLQSIIFPHSELRLPRDLYLREDKVGSWTFNTFFNVLNVEKIKAYCSISDLSLRIQGKGQFEVLVWGSNDLQNDSKILERFWFKEELYALPWKNCPYRFLYVEILFVDAPEITSMAFVTDSHPVNEGVRLGAAIVHFNRKEWVLPAIKRLKKELLDDTHYEGKISLVVVDNSQNITKEESFGVKILKNKNLGGTGGFARGLLYYKDLNFTHCLFMDDDASCEVESLKRTWALLSYAKVSRFAVAGSLLLEDEPSLIYEKGAVFNGTNRALSGGFDMTKAPELALVERERELPNYGGWWFFAFKITDLSFYPFPFFVRGDDLMFSLMNRFEIYTTNGIGTWGDEFASKATPLSCYLDGRSILLNNIVSCKESVIKSLIHLSKHFVLHSFLFNYATMRAIRLALEDTFSNESFWKENLDMSKIRAEIASFSEEEKMKPLQLSDYSYETFPDSSHRTVKGQRPQMDLGVYFRVLFLNGAFFPDLFMKEKYLLMPKGKYAGLKYAFRFNKMIIFDAKTSTGYVSRLKRIKLLQEAVLYASICFKVILNSKKYQENLERVVELYSHESFWRTVYEDTF